MSTNPIDIEHKKLNSYFLIGVFTLSIILAFWVLRPYLTVLLMALSLVVIFEPFHQWLLRQTGNKKVLSAILSTLLIFLIIVVPVIIFGSLVIREFSQAIANPHVQSRIANFKLPGSLQSINFNLKTYLSGLFTGFTNDFGSIFSNLAQIFIYFVLTVISLLYLFKDGEIIGSAVLGALPFTGQQVSKLKEDMVSGIRAVVGGYVLVAVIQGVVSGIGFWIFGVPTPALWGFVTVIAALIPTFGTSLVNIPAIIYLFVTHHTGAGIGMTAWWLVAISIIDNFVGPRFISGRVNIHILLLIFSVIGGLKVFGPLGFVIGPLIIVFFWSVLEMLQKDYAIEEPEPHTPGAP